MVLLVYCDVLLMFLWGFSVIPLFYAFPNSEMKHYLLINY